MRMRTQRQLARRPVTAPRRQRCGELIEPEPGPPPEAVFDRITGPYGGPYACSALALPGACEYDEET